MLLLTWHGTVVGLQEGGGGLVQLAPGEVVPGVALLDLELPVPRFSGQKRIGTRLGQLTVAAAPGGRGLTLSRYGRLLCAGADHREVAFNRDEASSHETFLPLTDQDLAGLIFVLGRAWRESASGRTIARQAVQLTPGFRMRLGGHEVDLAAWLPQLSPLPHGSPPQAPAALTVDFGSALLELVEVDEDGPDLMVAPPRQNRIQAHPASSLVTDPDVQAELTSWALAELSSWRHAGVSLTTCEKTWNQLNRTVPSLFLFHFRGQSVTLIEKSQAQDIVPTHMNRASVYLQFFTTVAAHLAPDCDFKIALGLADRLLLDAEAPVFSFQKTRGARTILVPDIDFLISDFHEGENVRDTLDFSEKAPGAVFVGATTGGSITPDIARTCRIPRLRAAKFFDGHRRIKFFLPAIVQCTTPEAKHFLEEMPFCQKQRMSWQEQFTHRFIISIDGNGATCSRVAIGLKSRSVLMKYASAEMLYYFHGLREWLHYVPVEHDDELDPLLDLDDWSPRSSEQIARAGTRFAERFLTRDAVTAYAVTLFSLYSRLFTGLPAVSPDDGQAVATKAETPDRPCTPVAIIAHIQNTGDRLSDQTGWAGLPEILASD